jgi:hypothetical protein
MLLTIKVLLTICTLGYSAVPTFFDFNTSHATNPTWTGHARYHVVWQVSSYDFQAIMALVLIWTAGENVMQLWVPAILALAAFGGFFVALLTMPIYGGILQDEVNGVPEAHFKIAGRAFKIDLNVLLFLPLFIGSIVAAWLLYSY